MADAPYSSSRNSFHAMRLALAMLVILCHSHTLLAVTTPLSRLSGGLMNEGTLAVDAFLTISGFLICQSAVRSRNALTFLGKRALRILPGFVLALAFSALIVGGLAYQGDYASYLRLGQGGPFSWMLNWLTLNVAPEQWGISGVFSGNPTPSLNVSLWTIKFEVVLYLVMALLMLTRLNRRRPTYIVFFAVFLILRLLLVCFRVQLWTTGDTRWWVLSMYNYDRFTQTGVFFFAGTILYAYRDRLPRRWYLAVIAGLLLALSCCFAFVPRRAEAIGADNPLRVLWQLGCVPLRLVYILAVAYLTIYLAGSPLLSGMSRMGDLSFGLYVYSYPIQQLLIHVWPGIPPMMNFLMTLLVTLPLAAWSWRCIESPALRLKTGRARQ